MSSFKKKVAKSWRVPVNSTEANRLRYERIKEKLADVDPDSEFDLSALLEAQLEKALTNAEKELGKLEKLAESDKKSSSSMSNIPSMGKDDKVSTEDSQAAAQA